MSVLYRKGKIHDVVVRPMAKFLDERGWLAELFRADEVDATVMPTMAYLSMTQPGIARGPHEHVDQTDYFCFLGPANFKVYLWDARPDSPTYGVKQFLFAGVDSPQIVIVPPGVKLTIVASPAQVIAGPRLLTMTSVVALSGMLLSVGGSTATVMR